MQLQASHASFLRARRVKIQSMNRKNMLHGFVTPVNGSKPRVLWTTPRDISLFPPLTQPSAPCMCKKQTVSVGTQSEYEYLLWKEGLERHGIILDSSSELSEGY